MTLDAAPGQVATERWRLTLGRADVLFPLRDYFRRLGATSEVSGPCVVEVESKEEVEEVEEWVASWVRVNGIPLDCRRLSTSLPPAAPPPMMNGRSPRIGELLIRKGFMTEDQLASSLMEARASNELLGVVLLRDKVVFEDELARTLSEQLSIPYISVLRIGVDARIVRLLPPEVGEHAAAIPVRMVGDTVQVVFADPTDPGALAEVQEYIPKIAVAVAELSDIRFAWRSVLQPPAA